MIVFCIVKVEGDFDVDFNIAYAVCLSMSYFCIYCANFWYLSEQPGESGGTERKKKKKKTPAAPLEDAAKSAALIAEAPATQFSSRALSFPPNNVFTEIFKMPHWGLGRDDAKKDSKDSA